MFTILKNQLDFYIRNKLGKWLFCYYMTKTNRHKIRYGFDGLNYFVVDGFTKFFFIRDRATRYRNGIKELGNKLAESYGIQEIKLVTNNIVVDVGANVGDFAMYLMKFQKIEYFGFEPSPHEFELLKLNLPDCFSVQNKIVSDSNSRTKFYVSTSKADSSIYRPSIVDKELLIDSVRLDCLFSYITLLKIDAEGAEFEVIKGAENILNNIRYIAVDLGFEKGIKHESPCPEVINYLLDKNFKIEKFTPRGCFLLQHTSYL
jgi:FkbM family methyltransferase